MIFLLDDQYPSLLPEPEKADENGMVAVSETLGIERLVAAYQKGIFPWMKMEQEPNYWCWFSPEPRMVLRPSNLRISRSLKKALNTESFEIRIDHAFEETMRSCARSSRPGQESTWIEDDMIHDYTKLHELGITHSIEAYLEGESGSVDSMVWQWGKCFSESPCFMLCLKHPKSVSHTLCKSLHNTV